MSFNSIIALLLLLSLCIILTSSYSHRSKRLNLTKKRQINRYTLLFNATEELFSYSKVLYFTSLINYILYDNLSDHIEHIIKLKAKDPSLKERLKTLRIKAEKNKRLVNAEGSYNAEPGPFHVPETEQKAIECLKVIKKLQRIVTTAKKEGKISESSANSELYVLDIYRLQVNMEYIFRKVDENITLEKYHSAETLLQRATSLLNKKGTSDYATAAHLRIKNYSKDIADAVEQLYLEQKEKEETPEDPQFVKQDRWWSNTE